MQKYNLKQLTDSLIKKTNAFDITWNIYNFHADTNVYSKRYFSTIPFLLLEKAFYSNFQEQGYIYLIPDILNHCGIFLQPKTNTIPHCLNVLNNNIIPDSNIEKLYATILEPFSNLDSFIDAINK